MRILVSGVAWLPRVSSEGRVERERRTWVLKGFNYPLTPTGKSTLNPSPPWHYSADFLDIALVTLKEPVTDRALLNQRPIVNLLHYPQLAADKRDEPAIHQLVENMPHDLKMPLW